jgi:maleate isomerase
LPKTPQKSSVDVTGQAVFDESADRVGIGLVAPFDLVLDHEYWQWVPDHVSLHITRTPALEMPMDLGMASAIGEAEVVAEATRSLRIAAPEVVAYACTSGSFVGGLDGEARLRAAMENAGAPHALTTSGALLKALESLNARRVAVATPYDAEVTVKLSGFLAEAGYEAVSSAFLGLTGDIFRVNRETVRLLARAADREEADAVFLSCTNLRTFEVLPEIEAELGKPVLAANQVTMWAAIRAAGLAEDWLRPPSAPRW